MMNETQPTTDFDNVMATLTRETEAGRLAWQFRAGPPLPSTPGSIFATFFRQQYGLAGPRPEPVAYEAAKESVTFVLARLVSSLSGRERLLVTASENVEAPSGRHREPLFTYMAEPGDAWFAAMSDLLHHVEAEIAKRTLPVERRPREVHERVQRALSVFEKQVA